MKFKQIKIETSCLFNDARQKLLGDFLNQFNRHIYFEPVNQKTFHLFVNSLDFRKFTTSAIKLKSRINKADAGIIDDVVSALDNIKSYGLKAGKRVYADYNSERKVKNRKTKSEQRIGSRKNTDEKQENDLPPDYRNKIVCGDSLEVLKELPNNCIDIMVTSPPYNFGLAYKESNDTDEWDAYFKRLFAILKEVYRVLKYGGRMVINVQPLFSDYIPTHHIVSKKMMDMGMLWKGEILWEKNNYNCKYTAWGSWKSPSSPYLKYTWEFLEIFCKGSLKHTGDKTNIDIRDDEFKKWVYAKWSIAPERNMKRYNHPAMFPEALVERVLKLFSYKNDVVLDVFNGVGTTTAVAERMNRSYLGIDISKEYCDAAKRRLKSTLS